MDDYIHEERLSKEQKIGFVLLLGFGVLTVGLGFLQIRNTIYDPFVVRHQDADPSVLTLHPSELADTELEKLQNIDTDQDGLSDADEIQYGTSRYIPDSDSDGILDGDEIAAGTDPNCEEGKTCGAGAATIPDIEEDPIEAVGSSVLNLVPTAEEIVGESVIGSDQDLDFLDVQALANDPDQIRDILLKTGQITEAQLGQIDDETLSQMVIQLIEAQGIEVGQNPLLFPQEESTTTPQ